MNCFIREHTPSRSRHTSGREHSRVGVDHRITRTFTLDLPAFSEQAIEVRAEAERVRPAFEVRAVDGVAVERGEAREVPPLELGVRLHVPPQFREDEIFNARDPCFAAEDAAAFSSFEL